MLFVEMRGTIVSMLKQGRLEFLRRFNKVNFILLAVCMAVVAFAAVLIGYNVGVSSVAVNANTDALPVAAIERQDAPPEVTPNAPQVVTNSSVISLPGFERLTATGRTLHADMVQNPAQNACYFIVTLIMPGGAELYRSGYLAPGESLGDVEMLVPLPAGTCEGVIARYSTFAINNLQPMNGADVKFILEVKP